MAQLNVEPKKNNNWWIWIVVIIAILLILWIFMRKDNQIDSGLSPRQDTTMMNEPIVPRSDTSSRMKDTSLRMGDSIRSMDSLRY